MNYRHAFHAGNFADCMKHSLLVWCLRALLRKPTPFFVLDTHAGAGWTDLSSGAAERTGEWRAGIGRLLETTPEPLVDYVSLVRMIGLYPGSATISRALMRDHDRLACCELHAEDHESLRRRFRGDTRIAVHRRDGYEAVCAFLPPAAKRAFLLIDPPFEEPGEFGRLLTGLQAAIARMPAAICAAWYPIKGRAQVRAFHDAVRASGLANVVVAELRLRTPTNTAKLNGCGLLIINPPFPFEREATGVLEALLDRLGDREPGEGVALVRLSDERRAA